MVLQRTFEVSHLKDYLRSVEGIHKMFEQLGYDVYDPEPLDAQDIDMSESDAQHVQAVYLINGMDFGHTIWLFEVDDTTTVRLRGLAYDVLQRAGTHTLVVTKDYREIIVAHPYFVGGTAKSHTRVNKLKIDSRNPTRHDVDTINELLARDRKPEEIYKSQDDAFNVNRVTNKFYKEYRNYFHQVQETVVAWNKGIAEFQNSDQRDKLHAFVQRLMGRLMFLYFLQRKGWLGGRSDFLTWQYKQMVQHHAGELTEKSTYYYREVLEPLFFDTLNKKRPENWTQWGVEIPYLNGGLFDRSRDPEGVILLPDTLFDPNSNMGLLAFFNRYNFTITDDAPMEQDVAVDPEMLGKVFENMLEEEDRGQSGSFYTPRTIVSYMCQEALAGYLEESTLTLNPSPIKGGGLVTREQVRQLFDPDSDFMLTPEQAQQVSDALDTLTVLDPAVGSGSFLIGMLNEIITLRKKCYFALTPKSPLPQQVEERGLEAREQWHIPQQMRERMTEIARNLRKNATPSEDILWQALRNRQLEDRKFKRQVDIGAFVVDFYCAKERLVVEVDGAIHETQQDADRERQSLIESLGIRFVRVTAEEVGQNLPLALDKIRSAFLPSPQVKDAVSTLPSPRETVGEGPGVRAERIAEWKEAIIRDTLYGVDIKPGAIEIAQLRLWLSLVVNQTMTDAKPLPNLDYKLMAGNSLIETIDGEPILTTNAQNMLNSAAKPQQLNMFLTAEEENRKLEDMRHEYFHATPEERKQLAADIRFQERRIIEAGLNDMLETVQQRISQIEKKYQLEGIQWKNSDAKKYAELLAKADHLQTIKRDLWDDEATLPFFLYRLHFNDVFSHKGGFDVVVANPPYVRQEMFKEQKPELQATYANVYSGRADLLIYFFARGYELIRPKGYLAFIASNKWLRAGYGKGLRTFLTSKITINTIIDFGDLSVFDAAAYPCVLIGYKHEPHHNLVQGISISDINLLEYLSSAVSNHSSVLPQLDLGEDGWQIIDAKTQRILELLNTNTIPLGEYVDGKFFMGTKTGLNDAFVIDEQTKNALIQEDHKSEEVIKPWLRGRDVQRWGVNWQNLYILFTYHGIDISQYPAIEKYLLSFKENLLKRATSSSHEWYELQQPQMGFYSEFEKPKIVYLVFQVRPVFAFDDTGHYINNAIWMLPKPDIFLLAILNSNIGWYQITNYCTPIQNGYQLIWDYFKHIRIPNAPDNDLRGKIASLAQKCLDTAKALTPKSPLPQEARGLAELEAELNQLVYQAYGLDEDDIRVIEGHLSGAGSSSDEDDTDGDEE